jgi:hypothetical protein
VRKATRRKYKTGVHPMELLRAAQPMAPSEVTRIMCKIHDAFARLRSGETDPDLFDRLAVVMNIGLIRSEAIGQQGVELFKAGQAALMEADDIYGRHGKYGFTGPGLEWMRQAIALYEEILAASTPLQMAKAQDECMRRIRMNEVFCPKALAVESRA